MQRTPQSTTSRQQILLTQHQAETLEALAESEGVSKSEIVRRALARYPGHEAIDDEEAAAVLAELSEALDHAIASVAATVEQLKGARARRDGDMAAERARVIGWAEEHPDELDALARALGAGGFDPDISAAPLA